MTTNPGGPSRLGTAGRPVRIVVVGSSVGMYVRPPRSHPDEGTYADLLETMLHDHGIHALVVNRPRWLLTVTEAHRQAQELIIDHRPDVVVLNVGFVESQPRLAPLGLVRWLFTWRPRQSSLSRGARAVLLGPMWWLYVHLSPLAIRLVPWLPSRVQPATVGRAIGALVRLARKERAALALVLDVPDVTARVTKTLPTIDRRIRATNAVLRDLAAQEHGPVVVPAAAAVAQLGHEESLPDGIHFSALGHQHMAGLIVEEILRWLETIDRQVRTPIHEGSPPTSL